MASAKNEKKRILIVEDDEDMREIYREMFENKGSKYEIETVMDARLGFKKLVESKFDFVILDIIMEPMSGDTFFATMKGSEELKDVPVIIVSVLDPEDLEWQIKGAKKIDFLRKPVTEEQLFEKIENFTAGKET
ncbi:MAG: PleD family two-component system response regulator [Candidatus Omnitrophota bacterium]